MNIIIMISFVVLAMWLGMYTSRHDTISGRRTLVLCTLSYLAGAILTATHFYWAH